jgi:hypothetical protein
VEGETTDVIICRQLSVSKGTGPGSRPSLGSPDKQKRAVGIRTRCQAQLEEEEDEVKREPGEDDETLVNEEKDVDDNLESDLPDINDIINGRS